MNDQIPAPPTRGKIFVRLLYTLLFVVIWGVVKTIIFFTTLFQFACLFVTLKPSEPVRLFANRVVTYAYLLWRYVTFNLNERPFPFAEFPTPLEPSPDQVTFE